MSLRERKKAKTRERLIAVAHKLFVRNGFESTTIDQIAKKAEVSRRTFFRYFPTKEAVVFPDNIELLEQFTRFMKEDSGESAFHRVQAACLHVASIYMSNREHLRSRYQVVKASPLLSVHDRQLDRDWEKSIVKIFRDEAPSDVETLRKAEILAGAIMGGIRATMERWFLEDCRSDLVERGEESFRILFGQREVD